MPVIITGLSGTVEARHGLVKPCFITGLSRTVADMTSTERPTLDDVIAGSVRRLRQANGWNQGDLAEAMASVGWSTSTVVSVETGRRQVKASEFVRLCIQLGVKPDDLLAGDGLYDLDADGWSQADLKETRDRLKRPHKPVQLEVSGQVVRDEERKMAKRLNMTPTLFRELVNDVYGRSLSEERDSRLGDVSGLEPRSIQAKRGRISAQIAKELQVGLTTHAGGKVIIRDAGGTA